jgi:hypothetical protein
MRMARLNLCLSKLAEADTLGKIELSGAQEQPTAEAQRVDLVQVMNIVGQVLHGCYPCQQLSRRPGRTSHRGRCCSSPVALVAFVDCVVALEEAWVVGQQCLSGSEVEKRAQVESGRPQPVWRTLAPAKCQFRSPSAPGWRLAHPRSTGRG